MPRAGEPPAPAPQRVTPTMIGSSPASGLKRRIEPTATGFDPSGKRALTTHGEFSRGADSRGGHSQGGAMMSHGGGGGGGATVMMLAPSPAGAASLPARATPGTLHCQLDGGEADPFAAAAAAAAAADGNDDAAPAGPVMLEARNAERHCDVVCSAAGTTRWTDRCGDSRATHIAGSSVFAAVFFKTAASSCTPRRAGARCRRWCFPVARRSCTRRVDSLWPSPAIVRSWYGSWGRRVVRRRPCGCPSLRSSPDPGRRPRRPWWACASPSAARPSRSSRMGTRTFSIRV